MSVQPVQIRFLSPFPREHVSAALDWMNEFPERNFCDPIVMSVEALRREILYRENVGEHFLCVTLNGTPIGFIGYLRQRKEIMHFHGICFAKAYHGTGIPMAAISKFLTWAFSDRVQQVVATHFGDNPSVGRFLEKLGGIPDGDGAPETRNGKPVQMKRVIIHADRFQANKRRGFNSKCGV